MDNFGQRPATKAELEASVKAWRWRHHPAKIREEEQAQRLAKNRFRNTVGDRFPKHYAPR